MFRVRKHDRRFIGEKQLQLVPGSKYIEFVSTLRVDSVQVTPKLVLYP